MDDVTAKTEAYTKQACTFGACPFEIRHQIYVLCLVTHVEIIPYPEAHEQETYLSVKAQFPSPALLAVNSTYSMSLLFLFKMIGGVARHVADDVYSRKEPRRSVHTRRTDANSET